MGLRILAILGEAGLSPRRLEIEVTESAIVRDLEAARDVLSSLRDAGVRIALDDFGTGYSSLYHLRNFKLDKIKIDRSFIRAMGSEAESAAIVRALTGLGNGLGLTITAEGIEGREECDSLLQQGCQQGQGFLFSKAVPAAETAAFFANVTRIRPPASYSGCRCTALPTSSHLAISARTNFAKSAGLLATGSAPSAVSISLVFGSSNIAAASAARRSTIAGGVPAGANMPNQFSTS